MASQAMAPSHSLAGLMKFAMAAEGSLHAIVLRLAVESQDGKQSVPRCHLARRLDKSFSEQNL